VENFFDSIFSIWHRFSLEVVGKLVKQLTNKKSIDKLSKLKGISDKLLVALKLKSLRTSVIIKTKIVNHNTKSL